MVSAGYTATQIPFLMAGLTRMENMSIERAVVVVILVVLAIFVIQKLL